MHSAPSVTYPVGRSHFQGWLIAVTGLICMLTGLLWCQQNELTGWRQWLFIDFFVCSSLIALYVWYRSPRGELQWDGQVWRWITGPASLCGAITAHIDLQNFLILSLRTNAGDRVWLWPERKSDVMRWHALRRAVFFRRNATQATGENDEKQVSL